MNSNPSPTQRGRRAYVLPSAAVLLFAAFATLAAKPSPPTLPPLTTVPGSSRLPGKFVWADLVTDDVASAKNFYGQLFGWIFRDVGGYVIATNDERPLCGMFKRARPAGKPEAQPRWFGYVSVKNVERTQRAVTKAGGRVLAAPQKFPKRGEQAIFADPEGALFGAVRSSAGDPQDFMAEPGDWIWVQLLSRDAKKASAFYREVADYDVIENTAGRGASDFVLSSEGYARATVRMIPGGHEKVQPNWLLFVRVKNLGESLALAKQLGGTVRLEPKSELLDGKVAVISDPTGAAIGLMEWSDAWMKGGH